MCDLTSPGELMLCRNPPDIVMNVLHLSHSELGVDHLWLRMDGLHAVLVEGDRLPLADGHQVLPFTQSKSTARIDI